jgi:membrane protease YdiL (CAAX protease family)
MLLSSAVGLYAFDYAGFERVFSELPYLKHYARSMVSDDSLARATLAAELLCLLFLLPLIRRMNASRLLLGQWSVLRSIASGVGLAFALMAANLALKRLTGQLPSGLAFGTNTIRAMQGLYALYGLSGLLAVAALLTPFVEEVIFRGALLGALSRHLRVWAGVLLQAFVFAFLHEDNSAVAFLFAFALVAAWLARRSGGLLAPIALHTTVNTFATLALVGFTQSVNSR